MTTALGAKQEGLTIVHFVSSFTRHNDEKSEKKYN
jgi:hypothetical protein